MGYVNLPGFVPLHAYLKLEALESLELLAFLAVHDDSPLKGILQEQLPEENRENYIDAIKEIGVIAQEARKKLQDQG